MIIHLIIIIIIMIKFIQEYNGFATKTDFLCEIHCEN